MRVDVSRLGEGEHLVQLAPQQVEAPAGVQVLRVSPTAVRITLARAAVKEVRVVPQVVGTPAAAHAVSRITVEPQVVEVRGPRTTIEEHTTVETAPVDVTGGRQTITRTVGLLLPDSVYTTTQRTVQVTVEIRAEDPMRPRQSGGIR